MPRTIWSALRGSTPRRTASSTVSSNLARGQALHQVDGLDRRVQRSRSNRCQASTYCLPCLAHVSVPCPVLGVSRCQPTVMPIERAVPATWRLAASRSLALRSGILVLAISVSWASVIVPTVSRPGGGRALLEPGRLAQQHRRGRRLQDEGERPVLVDRDLDRDDRAPLGSRWRRCTACRTPWSSRRAGRARCRPAGPGVAVPGRELDLHDGGDPAFLACHRRWFVLAPSGDVRVPGLR